MKYHFIRECVEDGKVDVVPINTEGQLADILTKPLGHVKFEDLHMRIGVISISNEHKV